MKFSTGRVMSFLLLVVLGGLTQFWAATLICLFNSRSADQFGAFMMQMMRDGGLFFFGTSLCFSSLLYLADKRPIRPGTAPFNISALLVGFVTLVALVGYTTLESSPLAGVVGTYPDSTKLFAQLSCTVTAVVYAIYAAAATGFFGRVS